MTLPPPDAHGEYGSTWIKGLDATKPDWPTAFVWSHAKQRWRKHREWIHLPAVKMLDAERKEP